MSDKKIRRLGTWDSRKPGQSPKEMKKLLEKADDTLKSTKMKPEFQSQVISSSDRNIIKQGGISPKYSGSALTNPITTQDRSTGGNRKVHAEYLRGKHYKEVMSGRLANSYTNPTWPSKTGVYGSEVRRTPMFRKSEVEKVKDKVTLNPKSRYKQFLKETMPHTNLGMEFRTPNKQRILEGGSPKRSITARAGAGLGWLKRKYLSYGASQWRKSKTH